MEKLALNEKYMLSINEAGAYFNIGVKKMRRLAEDNLGTFAVYRGLSTFLCKFFEKFLGRESSPFSELGAFAY